MARVTVEDCVEVVPNRFDLVLLASRRAREIAAGSPITIDKDNDRNPVIALREIAEQTIPLSALKENLIRSMQRNAFRDDSDEDLENEFLDAISSSLSDLEDDEDEENIAESLLLQSEAEEQLNILETEITEEI